MKRLFVLLVSLLVSVRSDQPGDSNKDTPVNQGKPPRVFDTFYPDDAIIDMVDKKIYKPTLSNIEANEIWKAEVKADQERFDFIDKMINIPDTLPVIPRTVREIINDSPFVWVIFAYDSSNKDLYPEILEFSRFLTSHFYQRVAVSTVDLAYPANRDTFEPIVEDQKLPLLMVKYPLNYGRMVRTKVYPAKGEESPSVLELGTLKNWGHIIDYVHLTDDPKSVIDKIDQLYETQHASFKICAVFMQHYNFVHYSERMVIYRLILQSYKDQLRMNLYEEAAKNRIADVDAIEAGGASSDREYKVLWKWINQKYTKKLQDVDLEVILDKQYHEKITELAKEYEDFDDLVATLDEKIQIVPDYPTDINERIPMWRKLAHKDEL